MDRTSVNRAAPVETNHGGGPASACVRSRVRPLMPRAPEWTVVRAIGVAGTVLFAGAIMPGMRPGSGPASLRAFQVQDSTLIRRIRCFVVTTPSPVRSEILNGRRPLLLIDGRLRGRVAASDSIGCTRSTEPPAGVTAVEYLIPREAVQLVGRAGDEGLIRVLLAPVR